MLSVFTVYAPVHGLPVSLGVKLTNEMKLPLEVTRGWESRFPDLYGKWTCWEISGDDYSIAIISGEKLMEAMKIIEDNYGKYSSLKASRAAVDNNGNISEIQDHLYEISNYAIDEKIRQRNETEEA